MNLLLHHNPERLAAMPVQLPLSKSIEARRCLLLAKQGEPLPHYDASQTCADIRAMTGALQAYTERRRRIEVGESGTALRFLTTLVAATEGFDTLLCGHGSLEHRPVADLVEVLTGMGADIHYAGREGFAPLLIHGRRLNASHADLQRLRGSNSSQFLSSLLLSASLMDGELPPLPDSISCSASYIELTQRMLQGDMESEADWSAASYFYLVTLLTGRSLQLTPTLKPAGVSKQGDACAAACFRLLGVESRCTSAAWHLRADLSAACALPEELDLRATPDLAPALAAVIAAGGRRCRLTGLRHLKVKESDRLLSIAAAIEALGFSAVPYADALWVDGTTRRHRPTPARIDCCNDHRIAMAFAPCAALMPVMLCGAECVEKSFPDFFQNLARCGYDIEQLSTLKS